jgi:hypothetical protein
MLYISKRYIHAPVRSGPFACSPGILLWYSARTKFMSLTRFLKLINLVRARYRHRYRTDRLFLRLPGREVDDGSTGRNWQEIATQQEQATLEPQHHYQERNQIRR